MVCIRDAVKQSLGFHGVSTPTRTGRPTVRSSTVACSCNLYLLCSRLFGLTHNGRKHNQPVAVKKKILKRLAPAKNHHDMIVEHCIEGWTWCVSARRFYPKTTVPIPTNARPCFRSVKSTYNWAEIFITKLANTWGHEFTCEKLTQWSWDLSTSFSGVGCAESAQYLALWKLQQISMSKSQLVVPVAQAALSLQAASRRFLAKHGKTSRHSVGKSHVRLTSSCEVNKDCQTVLSRTYGHCNWNDITTVDPLNHDTCFCTTHQRHCVILPKPTPGCTSFELNTGSKLLCDTPSYPLPTVLQPLRRLRQEGQCRGSNAHCSPSGMSN